MALGMTRPTRRAGSSHHQFNRRVPDDILRKAKGEQFSVSLGTHTAGAAILVPVKIGTHIKLSLRTADKDEAKARTATVEAQLQARWKAIRQGPVALSQKQIVALAGRLYTAFAEAFEREPGDARRWDEAIRANTKALAGEFGVKAQLSIHASNHAKLLISLESRFGDLADAMLNRECIVTDAASRQRLLIECGRQLTAAAAKLKRSAGGDYTPDPHANSIPKWESETANPSPNGQFSIKGLFREWMQNVAKPKELVPSTIEGYRTTFDRFVTFLGRDGEPEVTRKEVVRFAESRQAAGISATTVNGADLAALNSVFAWAEKTQRLNNNPARDFRVPNARKTVARPKGFTDAEAVSILSAAMKYQRTANEDQRTADAKRWVPWLCAYSGARIGEMVQLRKADLKHNEVNWEMTISPDAGTVKSKQFRIIPIHTNLVELGFLDFVSGAKGEYLFLAGKKGKRGGITNRIREFVRSIVADERVQPNHGWRHRFITQCRRHGVSEEKRRMITGHAGEGVDETTYGEAAGLFEEICKLPRYKVETH